MRDFARFKLTAIVVGLAVGGACALAQSASGGRFMPTPAPGRGGEVTVPQPPSTVQHWGDPGAWWNKAPDVSASNSWEQSSRSEKCNWWDDRGMNYPWYDTGRYANGWYDNALHGAQRYKPFRGYDYQSYNYPHD